MDSRFNDALRPVSLHDNSNSSDKRKPYFSKEFMLIQRNGLPRKGLSRSQFNLNEVGLSAVPIDFEGVKVPKMVNSNTAVSSQQSRTNADSYFIHPAIAVHQTKTMITSNIHTHSMQNSDSLKCNHGTIHERDSRPVSGSLVGGVERKSIMPPNYRQVCENPAYRQHVPPRRDSFPGISSLNSRSSLSSEENSPIYSPSKHNSALPGGYKSPGASTSSSLLSLESASRNMQDNKRPVFDTSSYGSMMHSENGRGSMANFQIGDHERKSPFVQNQNEPTIVAVQATSRAITMQPAKSFEVPKPVLQHTAIPVPLKVRKAGSTTPSKLIQFSHSPYQTPSPTGYEYSSPVGPLASGRCEPVRSFNRQDQTSSSQAKREVLESARLESEFPRTDSVETFISRTGSSGSNFPELSRMESVGPLATGRCEPVVSSRFRNNVDNNNCMVKLCRKEPSSDCQEEQIYRRSKYIAPNACKFYIEFHMENVVKYWDLRQQRREQLESEMMKHNFSESFKETWRVALNKRESEFLRERRLKMHRSNFTRIKTIGMGAFGEVALVRKNDTGKYFAMKTLSKNHIVQKNQIAHVLAERDILAEAENEWVVKLYYSFQDIDNLYLVMEYVPGGDLMYLLEKLGRFDEDLARFYTAELVCAIGSVHEMGFIHRDIKPDNILIDCRGHLKLTDFGLCTGFRWTHNSTNYDFYERTENGAIHVRTDSLAWHKRGTAEPIPEVKVKKPDVPRKGGIFNRKKNLAEELKRKFAHSQVGTPNYMAPEVLMSSDSAGYTQVCDWWSVGVILYEMLCGRAPFFANTPEETQLKVMDWRRHLNLSSYPLSPEAADLILRLCCDADERLGNGKSELIQNREDLPITVLGALEIRCHPFFRKIDWSQNIRLQNALYVPEVKEPWDTSNFDSFDETASPVEFWRSDAGNDQIDLQTSTKNQFYEFTFRRFFNDSFSPGYDLNPRPYAGHQKLESNLEQFSRTQPSVLPAVSNGHSSPSQLISPPEYHIQAPPPYSATVAPKSESNAKEQIKSSRDHAPVYV